MSEQMAEVVYCVCWRPGLYERCFYTREEAEAYAAQRRTEDSRWPFDIEERLAADLGMDDWE